MSLDRFATATPSIIKSHIFLLATLIATVFATLLAAMIATLIATMFESMLATLLKSLEHKTQQQLVKSVSSVKEGGD